MASIYGAYNKYTRLRIDYTITQNIESNKSTINMNMYAERTKGSHQYVSGTGSYYTMTNKDKTDFAYNWSASSLELYIGSSSVEVAHADDGTASVTLSGYWNTYRTGSSYIPAELSVSSTITLPTIARKSQVTLSSTNITLGNSVTIYTNRTSTNFTHSLYYQIGSNNWQTIATGITDNYSWNTNDVISKIASSFPNSSTGNLSIICETYNNGTYIGDTRATLNFSITSKPTVSSISKSGGISGIYVEDVSSVTINVTASGIYGSSISTYRMEMYNGNTKIKESYGSSASATFSLTGLNLSADATITLKATVTDTRGNSETGSTTITVKDYFKPQITSRSAYRCNSSGTADSNGTYLRIYWAYSTKSISGVTNDTAKVQYRQKGASSWTSVIVGNEVVVTVGGGAISTDYQYEVQFSISDNVSKPTVVTDTIPTGSVTVDYRAGGKGIAFGKVSEKDEFECNMPADFKHTIRWNSGYYSDTDYNLMTKCGNYYMTERCKNAPGGMSYVMLLVMGNDGGSDIVQIASSVDNGETWIRRCSTGKWHDWTKVMQLYSRGINDNFNNFTTTGIYICNSVPTGANIPIDMTGILEVFNSDGIITQRYTVWNGDLVYQRGFFDGNWSAWRKVAGTIMLTARPSSRLIINGDNWVDIPITLDTTHSNLSYNMLSVEYGGIRIGANIHRIKISATLSYYYYNALGEVDFKIRINENTVRGVNGENYKENGIHHFTIDPFFYPVSQGDLINIAIVKGNAPDMTILNDHAATSLTVEVIG